MVRATIAVLTPLWIGAAFFCAGMDHGFLATGCLFAAVVSIMLIGDNRGRTPSKD